jgi:CheY-like chemotaxis protein
VRPPHTILFIGPADDSREMYAEYLHWCGFAVIHADTTDDGLRRAMEAEIIVTEIRLRGSCDGVEMVRRVRNTEATCHTPVIVLTSCSFHAQRERAFAAGCAVFIATPCAPEVLGSEIQRLLTLRDLA